MDGGVPAFDVRRWHRQFAVAHLQDVLRDLQNPEPGPEEVWASLYGQARGNVAGDPTGLEGVFAGVGRTGRQGVRGPPPPDGGSFFGLPSLGGDPLCSCYDDEVPKVGGKTGTTGTMYNDTITLTCGHFTAIENPDPETRAKHPLICSCVYEYADSTLSCKSCPDPPPGDYMCCDGEDCKAGDCSGKCKEANFKQYVYDPAFNGVGGCLPIYQFSGTTVGSEEEGGGLPCSGAWKADFSVAGGSLVLASKEITHPLCSATLGEIAKAAGSGLQNWWENEGEDWFTGTLAGLVRWKSDQSDDPCTADFIRCTESFPPTPGVRYGHDLCAECLMLCQGQGYWPTHTKDGRSCIQGATPFGAGR